MQKISGFFANHGFYSVNNIHFAITETEKTFMENYNCKIVIKENKNFDPIRAQQVFKKSLSETDLLKLHLESECKNEKERMVFNKTYSPETKARYLKNKGSYFLFLLNELSELHKKIKFQLLEESGTTKQIITADKEFNKIVLEEQAAFALGDKQKVEQLSIQGEIVLYKQSCLRDELLRSTIDKLLLQYPDLCLQIIFGKYHRSLLEPYLSRKNIDASIVIHDEPGDIISDTIYAKIRNGKKISTQDKQMSVVADCITWLIEILRNIPEIMIHNNMLLLGKMKEAALINFSEKYYNQLVCGEGLLPIKTINFLEHTGVLKALAKEYPNTVTFCRKIIKEAEFTKPRSTSIKVSDGMHPEPKYTPCPKHEPTNWLPVSTFASFFITITFRPSRRKSVKITPEPINVFLPIRLADTI